MKWCILMWVSHSPPCEEGGLSPQAQLCPHTDFPNQGIFPQHYPIVQVSVLIPAVLGPGEDKEPPHRGLPALGGRRKI